VKYMLMLIRSDDEWESLGEPERDYEGIMRVVMGLGRKGRPAGRR